MRILSLRIRKGWDARRVDWRWIVYGVRAKDSGPPAVGAFIDDIYLVP